ncbi:ABC transporter ATP-binding protein [Flavobacterium difficile]|uniref:ABC transporter ATP-binding protein n=1 Tax=Flavobacterium difficile TaxID=2709659 RepID=A0ABX0I449_9FLAO|nr:ABC transporter ATP-binding protein [Flavobacterium difficile]NHM00928.1 ABC transporter ATP-binding protein [Flavobacterium difficile]
MLKINLNNFSYSTSSTLENISFTVEVGKQLSIIGESGCGKSSLLKIIYGLLDCDNGTFFWKDTQILGPKFHLVPGMLFMKYLAQDFDLMPFITVGENVGKFLSNFYPEEKQNRIDELLELVEMSEFKNVKAKFLSGGQMQRVALARVLAQEPEVLLLDEPFSHIDNFRKNDLRRKIFTYLKDKQITTLVASHDINDVLSFSDEVIVLKDKTILEKASPKELYYNPKHKYTAALFGDVNEVELNGKVQLIYPHQLKVVDKSEIRVEVQVSYFKGNHYLIESKLENQTIFFESEKDIAKTSIVYLKKIDL